MQNLLSAVRERVTADLKVLDTLRTEYANFPVVDGITVGQLLNGARYPVLVGAGTSSVDPQRGLFIRGIPIGELQQQGVSTDQVLGLLLTGELPSQQIVTEIRARMVQIVNRLPVLTEVKRFIKSGAMTGAAPMTRMEIALAALGTNLRANRSQSLSDDPLEVALDDCLTMACGAMIAAAMINNPNLQLSMLWESLDDSRSLDAFYAEMMCPEPDVTVDVWREFIRLFQVNHCDHGRGNASAHAATVVGSTRGTLAEA
ncbi:MAG: hypothetical protein KDD44_01310, partial [Bdellovibrionales bacterium]|nr:hypothetical protein [Bdellovibrionales bacterium]